MLDRVSCGLGAVARGSPRPVAMTQSSGAAGRGQGGLVPRVCDSESSPRGPQHGHVLALSQHPLVHFLLASTPGSADTGTACSLSALQPVAALCSSVQLCTGLTFGNFYCINSWVKATKYHIERIVRK